MDTNIIELTEEQSNLSSIDISQQKIIFGVHGTDKRSKIIQEYVGKAKYFDVTFHSGTTYESFIGEIRQDSDGQSFLPKSFAKAYKTAWEQPKSPCFIVIQNINGGDSSKIFGDLMQSLARNEKGYSSAPVEVNLVIGKWLTEEFSNNCSIKDLFKSIYESYETVEAFDYSKIILPPNLYIYATMNTGNNDISTMDSSFKRLWEWEYSPIDYYKANYIMIELSDDLCYYWGDFIEKVNKVILEITGSEKKLMGHHFVNPRNKIISIKEFKSKVISYLWLEVFADEYNNPRTIFRYKQDNVSADIIPFTLSDLYETSADKWLSDVYIMSSFMTILGIKKIYKCRLIYTSTPP